MNKKLIALVAATYLGSFMATLDISIVNVALPSIQQSISASISGMQWIINTYAVCLAAFILAVGGLSSKYGLKRVWLLGVTTFIISSAICAISKGLSILLIGRALQGVGGAIIIPSTLSIIFHAVDDVKLRSRIVGGWSTCTATALIIGPSLGGVLVDYIGWQSIFLINIPIGIVAFWLGRWGVKEIVRQEQIPLDICGQVLSIMSISGLVYAMIELGKGNGIFSLSVIIPFVFSIVLLIILVVVENKKEYPLIPLWLFNSLPFTLSNIASLILGFSYYSSLFLFSIFFQEAQGLSATQAGFRMMPIFLFTALFSLLFGRLNLKIATKKIMAVAYGLIGVAMLSLGTVTIDEGTSYLVICTLLVLIGIGTGLAVPATSVSVLTLVENKYFSTASSIMNSLRQAGMAFGVAILGAIMSMKAVSYATRCLDAIGLDDADSVAHSFIVEHHMVDNIYLSIYRESILYGFQWAILLEGVPCLIIALGLCYNRNGW